VEQHVIYVRDDEKKEHVKRQLTLVEGLTLIFVETKRGADALETWLYMQGFNATSIHGDRSQFEREAALKAFKSGQSPVMVATDVAARGLDIPAVSHVINYDSTPPCAFCCCCCRCCGFLSYIILKPINSISVPNDIDDYVHRIGRTGRAGNVVRAHPIPCSRHHPPSFLFLPFFSSISPPHHRAGPPLSSTRKTLTLRGLFTTCSSSLAVKSPTSSRRLAAAAEAATAADAEAAAAAAAAGALVAGTIATRLAAAAAAVQAAVAAVAVEADTAAAAAAEAAAIGALPAGVTMAATRSRPFAFVLPAHLFRDTSAPICVDFGSTCAPPFHRHALPLHILI
jgi:hypothetical protein